MPMYLLLYEQLTVEFGIERVRAALMQHCRRSRFFPHPSEIGEVLEEIVAKEKQEQRKANPFVPCERCHDGMIVESQGSGRDRRTRAYECDCKRAWRARATGHAEDRKSAAAGAA